MCREEEAIISRTDRRSAEAGRGRGADRGAGAASGDIRTVILAVEETVRGAGERCKPTFIAGKNLVEHQEQLQGWEVALGEDRAV